MQKKPATVFPWDVLDIDGQRTLPGKLGKLVRKVDPIAMFPPYPWGQWLYGKVILDRCGKLPGDMIETGVGLGGVSVFLALLIQSQGWKKRVYSVDSWQGLPPPNARKDNPYYVKGEYGPAARRKEPLVDVFGRIVKDFGVADVVVPVPGFFDAVLPKLVRGKKFCVVHIDADLFDSVSCALENVWDKVTDGGVVIIDDFFHHVQGPLRAASEFFNSRGLRPVYHVSFPYSVFVFKGDRQGEGLMRSLDGNVYSFEWLRKDRVLRAAVVESLARTWEVPEQRDNCMRLLKVLEGRGHRSSDIFEYWRALEAFWDAIGHTTPNRAADAIQKL